MGWIGQRQDLENDLWCNQGMNMERAGTGKLAGIKYEYKYGQKLDKDKGSDTGRGRDSYWVS